MSTEPKRSVESELSAATGMVERLLPAAIVVGLCSLLLSAVTLAGIPYGRAAAAMSLFWMGLVLALIHYSGRADQHMKALGPRPVTKAGLDALRGYAIDPASLYGARRLRWEHWLGEWPGRDDPRNEDLSEAELDEHAIAYADRMLKAEGERFPEEGDELGAGFEPPKGRVSAKFGGGDGPE